VEFQIHNNIMKFVFGQYSFHFYKAIIFHGIPDNLHERRMRMKINVIEIFRTVFLRVSASRVYFARSVPEIHECERDSAGEKTRRRDKRK